MLINDNECIVSKSFVLLHNIHCEYTKKYNNNAIINERANHNCEYFPLFKYNIKAKVV